jgi:pentatricopeptide repeat protein
MLTENSPSCPIQDAVKILDELRALSGSMSTPMEAADALLSVCEAAMDKSAGLDEAKAAFETLRDLPHAEGQGLHACSRAYNGILRACARRGAWKEARLYFDEMSRVCNREV